MVGGACKQRQHVLITPTQGWRCSANSSEWHTRCFCLGKWVSWMRSSHAQPTEGATRRNPCILLLLLLLLTIAVVTFRWLLSALHIPPDESRYTELLAQAALGGDKVVLQKVKEALCRNGVSASHLARCGVLRKANGEPAGLRRLAAVASKDSSKTVPNDLWLWRRAGSTAVGTGSFVWGSLAARFAKASARLPRMSESERGGTHTLSTRVQRLTGASYVLYAHSRESKSSWMAPTLHADGTCTSKHTK